METLKEQNLQINRLSINMEYAIKNALECYRVCSTCLQHCLALGGKHSEHGHITVMIECAQVCQIASSFMIATSDFVHDVAGICARLCDACADSCHDIDPEDPHMVACMVACRQCADSCRNMEH